MVYMHMCEHVKERGGQEGGERERENERESVNWYSSKEFTQNSGDFK